jgi:hypothetical protein
MSEAAGHPRGGTRRMLWKMGSLLALFTLTLIIGNFFVPADKAVDRSMIGHDFLAFFSAGELARTGQFDKLYDLTTIKQLESAAGKTAGFTSGFGPWWNPPFAAWAFAPFSVLPFPTALRVWVALGAAMLLASIALLARMIPGPRDWRNWWLLVLLVLASNPAMAVFTHAQNTFLTLLILTLTVTFWRARRAFIAGLVAGLLLYKPQHAAIIAAVLCFSLGWRALIGFGTTVLVLVGITIVTMPGAIDDYAVKLPRLLAVMQELSPYSWDRHVTLKAFWRLLMQGTAAGETKPLTAILWYSSELAVAAQLLWVAMQARRDLARTDRLIALTIISGPLLVPFCFDYDLMILAIPAVLFARQAMGGAMNRRLLWGWIVLYAILNLSTPLARITHVVLVTPMLVVMCGLLAADRSDRAAREIRRIDSIGESECAPAVALADPVSQSADESQPSLCAPREFARQC